MPLETRSIPMSDEADPLPVAAVFRPAPHVRARLGDQGATLIDLHRDRYISLNVLGALIWRWVAEGLDRESVLSRLGAAFPERQATLGADLDRFLHAMIGQGLLVRPPTEDGGSSDRGDVARVPDPGRARAARRPPSLGRCWLTLVWMDVLLRGCGLRTFCAHAGRCTIAPRPALSQAEIAATCARVDRAARAYFRHAWCLQRSAAVVWLLRKRGVDCDLVLGVRSVPFAAHAWCEAAGEVINDVPSVRDRYEVIERCRARTGGRR